MIGYYTDLAEAETYFAEERLETAAWDALAVTSAKDEKTACLKQAYARILHSREFAGLPTPAAATAAQLEKLKPAQAEMAYYLAEHLSDEDTRKGLHAQGVVGASVLGEAYVRFQSDSMKLTDTPIPPVVRDLLVDWSVDTDVPFHVVEIGRDEDYGVEEDVTDHL